MIKKTMYQKRKELSSFCAAPFYFVKKITEGKDEWSFIEKHTSHKSIHVQKIVLLCAKNQEPVCGDKNNLVRPKFINLCSVPASKTAVTNTYH